VPESPPAIEGLPPRRRRRPEEARADILEAADELLRTQPSRRVTIAAVMKSTGLTREAFYAYFRDRHDLITALVAPLRIELDEYIELWRSGTGALEDDGRASILGIARIYARDGTLLRALAEASSYDEEARRAWQEFTEPAIRAVAERITSEVAAQRMRPFDVAGYVHSLVHMNLATFFSELIGQPDATVEAVVDRLATVWMRTLDGFRT